jgi:hypothetical protein
MRAALVCLVAVGCSNASIGVQLRVPSGDHPLAGADAVAVTLRDGSGQPLAFSRSAASAGSVELAHAPGGAGYTVEVDATFGADVLARGRSCSFDVDASKPPTVPIWFSRIGRFAATSGPDAARSDAATFAWGGGALVAGGTSAGAALATTESYDPVAGRFSPGPMLSTPRAGARAVALADGTVLVIGGAQKGAPALEALTASHTTPEPAGLAPELVRHAATLAGDGSVIVAGGITGGKATDGAWIITAGGASVEPLPPLVHARERLTITSASSDPFAALFVVGGVDGAVAVAEVEIFDPTAGTFSLAGIRLLTPRSDHTVTRLPTGLLLVVGGVDVNGEPIAAAEIIDPINRVARPVASLRTARARHAAMMLPSGRVLVTGGYDAAGQPLTSAEIFDPTLGAEGDFVPTASLDSARSGHALVPLCDGTYLVVGGASGAEIYNPL